MRIKRIITITLAATLLFSCTACGKKKTAESKPTNEATVTTEATSSEEHSAKAEDKETENTANSLFSDMKVEEKGNTVYVTSTDSDGNTCVQEYTYKKDVLSKITMTTTYADVSAAKAAHKTLTTGDRKASTEQTFSKVEVDGNKVICTMTDELVSAFSVMTKEQLVSDLKEASK
ncbi:MAG: hypothetical protein ACI4CT_05855 [Lachnospiraceae bacterium]